jgi:hypothetical protein
MIEAAGNSSANVTVKQFAEFSTHEPKVPRFSDFGVKRQG